MIKTIEKRICDVCKQEVTNFAGSVHLKYFVPVDAKRGRLVDIERKEICIDCCLELNKALRSVLVEDES